MLHSWDTVILVMSSGLRSLNMALKIHAKKYYFGFVRSANSVDLTISEVHLGENPAG